MLRTIGLLAIITVPAAAEERGPPPDVRMNVQLGSQGDHARPKPDCMCRLRSGTRVPLGSQTCIRVDGREYVAECRLSQNVSAWREIAKGCPSS